MIEFQKAKYRFADRVDALAGVSLSAQRASSGSRAVENGVMPASRSLALRGETSLRAVYGVFR